MASKGFQGKTKKKKSKSSMMIFGVFGVVVLGLLAFGMSSVFQVTKSAPAASDPAAGESAGGVAVVSRESKYLGAPTDAAALAKAESGEIGTPTVVFFHADW